LAIIIVDFDVTGQLLIIYSTFVKYLKKMGKNGAMHHVFFDLKTAYDSVRREVLYNILIVLGIPILLLNIGLFLYFMHVLLLLPGGNRIIM